MARLGPPGRPPKSPRKSLCGSPFLRSFPGNEAHKLFFLGAHYQVFWVAKKFMLKKFMCFFGPPTSAGMDCVSVGLLGSQEQGNLRKCSPRKCSRECSGCSRECSRECSRGCFFLLFCTQREHPQEHSREHSREHPEHSREHFLWESTSGEHFSWSRLPSRPTDFCNPWTP